MYPRSEMLTSLKVPQGSRYFGVCKKTRIISNLCVQQRLIGKWVHLGLG